jgi:hypothetical protein
VLDGDGAVAGRFSFAHDAAAIRAMVRRPRSAGVARVAICAAATACGCRHPHAIRILARAWLRIIWRCWQDGTAFDPALDAAAA